MPIVALILYAATCEVKAVTPTAILGALSHQTEVILRDTMETSEHFARWCKKAIPWTTSLSTVLQQQRRQSTTAQHEAEKSISRIGASQVLGQKAKTARGRLVSQAKRAFDTEKAADTATRGLEEKARTALDGSDEMLVKLSSGLDQEKKADHLQESMRASFLSRTALTDEMHEVELRSLEIELADRQRARARYHTSANDYRLLAEGAQNSSKAIQDICVHQEQEALALHKVLTAQMAKAQVAVGAEGPLGDVFATRVPAFFQESRTAGIATDTLLHDIDALTVEHQVGATRSGVAATLSTNTHDTAERRHEGLDDEGVVCRCTEHKCASIGWT